MPVYFRHFAINADMFSEPSSFMSRRLAWTLHPGVHLTSTR